MRRRTKWFCELLLALLLAFGALTAIIAVLNLGIETIGLFDLRGEESNTLFNVTGEPYLHRIDYPNATWRRSGEPVTTNVDLDGNLVEPRRSDFVGFTLRTSEDKADPIGGVGANWQWMGNVPSFQVYRPNRSGYPLTDIESSWFFMHDGWSERGYFVGYTPISNETIGFIGTAGFRSEPLPTSEWFTHPHSPNIWPVGEVNLPDDDEAALDAYQYRQTSPYRVVLNCEDQLLVIDLRDRKMTTIYSDPAAPVRDVALREGSKGFLLALTDDAIYRIDPQYEQQRIELPPELRRRTLTVAPRKDGGLTIEVNRRPTYGSEDQPVTFYVLAADGALSAPRNAIERRRSSSSFGSERITELALASPLIEAMANWPGNGLEVWRRYEGIESYRQYLALGLWDNRWWFVTVWTEAAILAALCYCRARRYQLSPVERIVWPIFVFLFGVPGWIGYRYCRRWPPLEVCPACHQPAPRNDEACAKCQTKFPLPVVTGTEIFV